MLPFSPHINSATFSSTSGSILEHLFILGDEILESQVFQYFLFVLDGATPRQLLNSLISSVSAAFHPHPASHVNV